MSVVVSTDTFDDGATVTVKSVGNAVVGADDCSAG